MHHGNGAFKFLLLQIQIEFAQLAHQKHTLVHQRAGGEGAHIGAVAALLKHPADHIELPLKVQPPRNLRRPGHKALPDGGHGIPGPLAQDPGVDGHLPPAQEFHALLGADHLAQLLSLAALQAVLREEEHADAIVPGLSQRKALH